MKERIDWKQELLDSANFNGKLERILKYTPDTIWKQLKGIREPSAPNCQSSFLECKRRLAQGEFYVPIEDDVLYPD